ncbi:hypothetical protein ACFL0X_01090 [Nanoarchaeota archaeon]
MIDEEKYQAYLKWQTLQLQERSREEMLVGGFECPGKDRGYVPFENPFWEDPDINPWIRCPYEGWVPDEKNPRKEKPNIVLN